MLSEKYDGWFAKWDGSQFTTASGATISAPDWFTSGLPTTELRGELHAGRGGLAIQSAAAAASATAMTRGRARRMSGVERLGGALAMPRAVPVVPVAFCACPARSALAALHKNYEFNGIL